MRCAPSVVLVLGGGPSPSRTVTGVTHGASRAQLSAPPCVGKLTTMSVVSSRLLLRRAAALGMTALATTAAAGAADAQAGSAKTCPKHTTEMASNGISKLWTDHGKLWSCTTYGGRKPQNRQLGPWTTQSQFILGTGGSVGWTQRTKISGAPADLVWAADLSRYTGSPRYLSGVRPAFGPGSGSDLRVAALTTADDILAWVTGAGRVVSAYSGTSAEPTVIGAGTPGAADLLSDGSTGPGLGLLAAPQRRGNRIITGQWTGLPPAALADTLEIKYQGGGESDECGGSDEYDVFVTPVEGQPHVGTALWIDRTYDSPACR